MIAKMWSAFKPDQPVKQDLEKPAHKVVKEVKAANTNQSKAVKCGSLNDIHALSDDNE